MPGEVNLETLLESLSPTLLEGEYVFCSLPHLQYGDRSSLSPIASVLEPEGLTLVVRAEDAEGEKLTFHSRFRCSGHRSGPSIHHQMAVWWSTP